MTSPSPTVRRRELGARLRSLRLAAGLTVEDVAVRMEVSQAKISRIETAARGVSVTDVRFLCEIYGVPPEERDRLLTLTREGKRRSWWQEYDLPESAQTYAGLEDAATSIQMYDTSFVPALLQTERYASALTAGASLDTPAEQVEQFVRTRMVRQERLAAADPPEFWAVLDEVALHRPVGGVEVMREQLDALLDRARWRNITIQVLPLDAGAHPGMNSAFTILHLEGINDVVYVEGLIGQFFLQSAKDLARYRRALDHLRAIALSPRGSLERIDALRRQLSP